MIHRPFMHSHTQDCPFRADILTRFPDDAADISDRGDPKPIPKAESKPVVPKAKGSSSASASGSQKDARANAIDASFTVKEGSGA